MRGLLAPAARGLIQGLVRNLTWEEAKRKLSEPLPEGVVKRARGIVGRFPSVLEEVTLERIIEWADEANPKLVKEALSDPEGARLLRESFERFISMLKERR